MAIKASSFRLTQLSRHIFFAPGSWSGVKAANIAVDLADTFDDAPVIIPLSPNAPPEIPRCILKAKDGSHELQITLDRIVEIWNFYASDVAAIPRTVDTKSIFDVFSRYSFINVLRAATVLTRVLSAENPADLIARYFCRPEHLRNDKDFKGPLNRPESFEIHSHKIYIPVIPGVPINSWMRIKSGQARLAPEASPETVVIAIQDLNTLDPEGHEPGWTTDQLFGIFEMMSVESESIISRYFPE